MQVTEMKSTKTHRNCEMNIETQGFPDVAGGILELLGRSVIHFFTFFFA